MMTLKEDPSSSVTLLTLINLSFPLPKLEIPWREDFPSPTFTKSWLPGAQ